MSLNESWPRYEPFSPHVLNDDLAHFDDRHQFDPSPYGQSSPYDFDDAPELALERFDTRCPDMFNGSSWPSVPSQTFDYVHCQEEQLYPFDDTTILQSGSIGRCESEYSHSSPDWSAITQYDGHQFEPASRGGRSRGVEAQPVKCSECHQMFDSLQSLEQHTKTELHKIWRCPDMGCGKAYPRRDTLARHQLKHSDKGHACSICQQNNKHKVFKRRDHLAEHIRKRHAPSTDDMSHGKPRKHEAMQGIVKSLEAVLGEGHHTLQGLESTMTAMSSSKMECVAVTIAERIAQFAADPDKG